MIRDDLLSIPNLYLEPSDTGMMPIVADWQIYCYIKDGPTHRFGIIKRFFDFWSNREILKLKITSPCFFGGQVYGEKDGSVEANSKISNRILYFDRVKHHGPDDDPHDLMCCFTDSGPDYAYDNRFYFYSDGYSRWMQLMLLDISRMGRLEEDPKFYLSRECKELPDFRFF